MKLDPLLPQLGFALDSFLLDGQSRNLRPKTLDNYRWRLTQFLLFTQESGCADLCDITPHTIRSFFVHLRTVLGWAPASVHSAARSIKSFFRYCGRDDLLTESPMARVQMPVNEQPAKAHLTVEETKRLWAVTTNQRDKAMVLCLLDSGCRVAEFTAWNVGDVDLRTGAVHLRRTKNRAPRTVFLGAIARRELAKHYRSLSNISATDPIWVDPRNGERMKPNGVNQALRRLGRAADVWP
jgi:site-specific recombinase XerD